MDSNSNASASSSTSTVSVTVLFLLRVLTFVFLLVALILTLNNKTIIEDDYDSQEFKFNNVHTYRYTISTIAIGLAYTKLQMALSVFTLVSRKRILSGDVGYLLDFFGDKIVSYLLISGSAAGFGATGELQNIAKISESPLIPYFEKANTSASLLLIGFLFTAVASVVTSFALPKKA